jgi:hypothetical protein
MKDKEFYIKKIGDFNISNTLDIVNAIRAGIVTFKELSDTGCFGFNLQKLVTEQLAKFEKEDNAFRMATTLPLLRDFLSHYKNSPFRQQVEDKIYQKEAEEREIQRRKFEEVKKNINKKTPDQVKKELGEDFLRNLCSELRIDYEIVDNYDEPPLDFNDIIPQNADDIPPNYTDVLFWGIPSSGKTCALSAIFNTIDTKYTMEEPEMDKKTKKSYRFGATYRDSLTEIFTNETGYLPSSTRKDRTQYMPFLLKRRGEKKYRRISFFELSGEVFKYFYELTANTRIIDEDNREDVMRAFETLELLLNNNNQKIHFFFIDYNQATQNRQEQAKYLRAASTYFRDTNDIFKKKTDAVYVIVTKADEIRDENNREIGDKEKTKLAKQFLSENFGNFMDSLKERCANKKYSIDFNVKIFSIGNVYFSKICKINRKYAEGIIDDLLDRIVPYSEDGWLKKALKS